jgi:4-hydroxy-2-oxoheptanedioate aldolase
VAARRRVAAAARANGKFAMSAGMFEPRSVLEAEGFQVFNLGADVLGLGDYFRAKAAEFGPP